MFKVCECYDKWNECSEDCEWSFDAQHASEIYCPACKPIARKARIRQAVQKHRGKNLDELLDSTEIQCLAVWIDKVCTCCGRKGVPTFNRFLCWDCWKAASYDSYPIPPDIEVELSRMEQDYERLITDSNYEEPGPVIIYSSEDYTQEQLRELLQS